MLEPAMLRPATEAVLQAAPRAALSAPAAARVQRNGPSRLVARMVAGSPAHFAEENAALRLGGWFRLHDFHHHRFSRNGEILHHRIGDVLDQRALLIERAALDGVDVDF